VADAARTHDLSVRDMAERTREQAEAARIQAVRATELPALREAEAAPPPGCNGSPMRAKTLDREEERAKERVAELDRRLTQFSADIAREQQQTSDAEVALARLDAEDTELKEDIKSRVEKRSGVDERVSEAETTLAAAERLFAELTTVLADLTAKRNQLEAGVRTHCDRAGTARSGYRQCRDRRAEAGAGDSGLGDLAALTDSMETAQQNLAAIRTGHADQRIQPCRRAPEAGSRARAA